MKLFLVLALVSFSSIALSQDSDSLDSDCFDQSVFEESLVVTCNRERLNLLSELLREEFFRKAKLNDPAEVKNTRLMLEKVYNKILSCDPTARCSDFKIRDVEPLSMGWKEEFISDTWEIREADGSISCNIMGEIYLKNKDVSVRGTISRAHGNLSYQLPDIKCSNGEVDVRRNIRLTEHGSLLWDYSDDVDQFPGKWLISKTKRTPQFEVNSAGNMVFKTADDATFEVDSETGGLLNSNFLNPEMFNPHICKTLFSVEKGKRRSYTEVLFQEGAKSKFVSEEMYDFGGTSQERRLNSIVSSLRRRDL